MIIGLFQFLFREVHTNNSYMDKIYEAKIRLRNKLLYLITWRIIYD